MPIKTIASSIALMAFVASAGVSAATVVRTTSPVATATTVVAAVTTTVSTATTQVVAAALPARPPVTPPSRR